MVLLLIWSGIFHFLLCAMCQSSGDGDLSLPEKLGLVELHRIASLVTKLTHFGA